MEDELQEGEQREEGRDGGRRRREELVLVGREVVGAQVAQERERALGRGPERPRVEGDEVDAFSVPGFRG